MKRKLSILVIAVLSAAVMLSGCRGDVREVKRTIGESSLYSQEEIQAAMDAAIHEFRAEYNDCKLLSIRYDEEKTISESEYRREHNNDTRIMVLLSDFEVGDHADAGFNPNDTYKNWKWIMSSSGSGWQVLDCGYG